MSTQIPTRTLGSGAAALTVSALGLGCMGMSEFYGEPDDAQSLRTLERAFELGVTHYDTSNVYGRGHNERLLSQFLKGRRDRVMLASKFGVVRDPDGPLGSTYDRGINNDPAYMRQCCEESLRRLGVETIDLYYVHRVDGVTPIEDTVGAMADLVPLKRMGSLEEVADMALFLGSARARYVTGAIIPVDGGISLVGGRDLSAGLNP